MAQTQFSSKGKYALSGRPRARRLVWTLAALALAALSAAGVIGLVRTGFDRPAEIAADAIDLMREAIGAVVSRPSATVAQHENAALVREGAKIIVPEDSPIRGKLLVGPVREREIQRKLVLPAIVEADPARTVKVLPPVTGHVTDLMVQLGERVTQGQELAVIDSGDLAQAYADIEKAKSVVTLTKKVLDRQQGLEKAGGAAIKDREQAQSDYIQAVAELERAHSRLRAIGVSADQKTDQKEEARLLTLKAPVAGSVIDLQVARGAFLNDPTAAIMTIANLGTVWITANVPENDTAFVTKGQDVQVALPAYPGETFAGKVLFISDILDPDTRRTKVRIAFANPDVRLKPNMFAEATFLTPRQMVPIVPTQALILKNENDQVFVEVAPSTYEARAVQVGFQQGDQAVIERGLKPGERVVMKGGVLLND